MEIKDPIQVGTRVIVDEEMGEKISIPQGSNMAIAIPIVRVTTTINNGSSEIRKEISGVRIIVGRNMDNVPIEIVEVIRSLPDKLFA